MVMAFPPSGRGMSVARPQPQDTRKGVDCQFWIKGHCGRGASCAFKHDKVSGLQPCPVSTSRWGLHPRLC